MAPASSWTMMFAIAPTGIEEPSSGDNAATAHGVAGASHSATGGNSQNEMMSRAPKSTPVRHQVVFCCVMSGCLAEQARRLDEDHDRHDDKDPLAGGFGIELLGQALDPPQADAGDDRPADRAHAADHHHGE